LSDRDFARVSYVSTGGFLALSIYAFLTRPLGIAVMAAVQWFAIVCLPLVLAQRFSTKGQTPAAALFTFSGRLLQAHIAGKAIDMTYPYFAICILAAAAANSQ